MENETCSSYPVDLEPNREEFRAKVIALLNSNWPRRAEIDEDTVRRAQALAGQLRNWESWK